MGQSSKSTREALAELRQVWRESADFFVSIELWLMVASACASVAGVWLAFMGDVRSLLAFGAVIAYLVLRVVLHIKRVLAWPFI